MWMSMQWDRVPNWLMAIAAIVGVPLLICELKELRGQSQDVQDALAESRAQTSALQEYVRQSYRPLGVVRQFTDKGEPGLAVGIQPGSTPDRFTLGYSTKVWNLGTGPLLYLGHMFYISTKEVAFREALLDGTIKDFQFDGRYNYSRRSAIIPGEFQSVGCVYPDLRLEKKYFLYVLFLYEDQASNLYDTDHLLVLPFGQPTVSGERMLPTLTDETWGTDKYGMIDSAQRDSLVVRMREKKHPLADLLSERGASN